MRQIYETIDRQGFQWIVVLVAGLGFFLDGYTVRYPTFHVEHTIGMLYSTHIQHLLILDIVIRQ